MEQIVCYYIAAGRINSLLGILCCSGQIIYQRLESRQVIDRLGLVLNDSDTAESVKTQAFGSLAKNDRRSNIV